MAFRSVLLSGLLSLVSAGQISAPISPGLQSALLDAYHQGKVNNCGSVALTKLVISKYGTNPQAGTPFARHEEGDRSVSVQLIDGALVYVTPEELQDAANGSGFSPKGGKEVSAADYLYAVMAVRRSGGNDGRKVDKRDFRRAISSLGHGGDPADEDVLPPLLGFKFDDSSPAQFQPLLYAVGSGSHIAYSKGDRYDEHGVHGGESIEEFYDSYGTPTMYRYALSTSPTTPNMVVRQCADGKDGWNPSNASWRVCRAGEVTRLDAR